MKVPLLDLKPAYDPLKEGIAEAIQQVLQEQVFVMGPRVEAFEAQIARYVGTPHALSCANGSDALLLALMALNVGPGDEVITSPFSFFATAGSIARLGAVPVFVDIEEDGFNIDAGRIEAAITPRTRAILPVHLFGQCASMDEILEVAGRHRIPVVEDAAQALGAQWKRKMAGTFGAIGCFSFFPTKNLGAFGDGGLLTTGDRELADRLRALRTHGGVKKYHHEYIGMNSRLDAIQAAILSVKLPSLEKWHAARQHNACKYYAMVNRYDLQDHVTLPVQRLEASHIYNQFVIRVPDRDRLQAYLKEREIGTEVYYPRCLHEQPCFKGLGYQAGDFPRAEAAAATALALPVYPGLEEAQLDRVMATIAGFYRLERGEGRPA